MEGLLSTGPTPSSLSGACFSYKPSQSLNQTKPNSMDIDVIFKTRLSLLSKAQLVMFTDCNLCIQVILCAPIRYHPCLMCSNQLVVFTSKGHINKMVKDLHIMATLIFSFLISFHDASKFHMVTNIPEKNI